MALIRYNFNTKKERGADIMFCPKCGTELPEGSQFCPGCGSKIDSRNTPLQKVPSETVVEKNDPTPVSQISDTDIRCPKCGSIGCTPINKQTVSGGGYGCLQGGLGALILGPFGLLCGLCGRSTKTTNTLVWVCPKCGNEFRLRKDVYSTIIGSLWIAYLFGALCTFTIGGAMALSISGDYGNFLWIISLLTGLCAAFCAYIAFVIPKGYNNSSLTEFLTEQEQKQLTSHAAVAGIICLATFLISFIL